MAPRSPDLGLTAVSCNHCGGSLDVAERTRFTTCGYCGTRLRVERSANAWSTIELDELQERTSDIERSVSALRDDKRVEQLDRQWELRREEFRLSSGDGEPRLPTVQSALMRLLTALIPIALLLTGSFDAVGGFVVPVLVGVTVLAIGQAGIEGYKVHRYRVARATYEQERAELLSNAG